MAAHFFYRIFGLFVVTVLESERVHTPYVVVVCHIICLAPVKWKKDVVGPADVKRYHLFALSVSTALICIAFFFFNISVPFSLFTCINASQMCM